MTLSFLQPNSVPMLWTGKAVLYLSCRTFKKVEFCLILSTFKNPFSFANMYYTEVTKNYFIKMLYNVFNYGIFLLCADYLMFLISLSATASETPQTWGKLHMFGKVEKIPRQQML